MRSGNFIEESASAIAGTSGNGAVTLAAIAGTPRFATVLGAGAVTVRYVIEDTASKKMEVGIGSVAANVLTRTKPQMTWDGTTYAEVNPAPLAFGSTPTAGIVRVRIAAVSATLAPTMPAIQTLVGGAEIWRDYPLSAHLIWSSNAGATTSVTGDIYSYYKNERAGLLTGVQLEVMSSQAISSAMPVALYSIGANGLPDRKIVDFNPVNASVNAVITDTANATWSSGGPLRIDPGWFCVGLKTGAPTGFRGFLNGSAQNIALPTPMGRFASYASYRSTLTAANTAGAPLPDVPVLTSAAIGYPLWIGLKVE